MLSIVYAALKIFLEYIVFNGLTTQKKKQMAARATSTQSNSAVDS
jgi:hypothetical protein